MAIYDLDYMNESFENDSSDDVLDGMLEACDYMMDLLNEHGGARRRYVEMKEKENEEIGRRLYDDMPDKKTKAMKKEEKAIWKQGHKNEKKINKYSTGDSDNWSLFKGSARIHNAGKPMIRDDSGSHGFYDRRPMRYEDIVDSRRGKDAFNKKFGGPGGEDYLEYKTPGTDRFLGSTFDHSKEAAKDNKEVIKKHLEESKKKKAVKEACLNILASLDDID